MPAPPRSSLIIALALLSMLGPARLAHAQTGRPPAHPVETGLIQPALVQPAFTDVFSGSLLPWFRVGGAWMPFSLPYTLTAPAARDSAGTEATFFAGERSLAGGRFRHEAEVGDGSSFRASGHYLKGNDWPFADSVEVRLREASALLQPRDNGVERWGGEVGYAGRRSDNSTWMFQAGLDRTRGNQLTDVGAAYSRGTTSWHGLALHQRGRLSGYAVVQGGGTGEASFYRTARAIENQWLLASGRLRYATELGDRQQLDYQVDVSNMRPSTNGTVTGVYEDDDDILVAGGTLNSLTRLTDSLHLEAGLRVESHSRIEGLILSPNAALVYRPAPGHRFRATAERVQAMPAAANFVMDITAGRMNAGAFTYDLYARGVPASGFTFNDRCPGGFQDLCMRSPLAPGEKLPADPSVLWNTLVEIAAASDPLALRPLRPFFRNPEPGELQPRLLLYNQKEWEAGRPPFLGEEALGRPIGVRPIDPLQPTTFNTVTLSYRGEARDRGHVSAEIWRSSIDNFIGPLRSETPTVFFDPTSLRAFIERRVEPMVRLGIVYPELVDLLIHDLTNLASQLPVGTIMPDQITTPGLLLTYRNYGTVNLWGANLSGEVSLSPALSLEGAYSYVSEECFDFLLTEPTDCSDLDDISLNVPKTRSSFSVRYQGPDSGFSAEARMRRLRGFYANAGVYAGDVEGYAVLDARIQLPIPSLPRTSAEITATNLLDDLHQEFIGAPEIGRLVVASLTYAFR